MYRVSACIFGAMTHVLGAVTHVLACVLGAVNHVLACVFRVMTHAFRDVRTLVIDLFGPFDRRVTGINSCVLGVGAGVLSILACRLC